VHTSNQDRDLRLGANTVATVPPADVTPATIEAEAEADAAGVTVGSAATATISTPPQRLLCCEVGAVRRCLHVLNLELELPFESPHGCRLIPFLRLHFSLSGFRFLPCLLVLFCLLETRARTPTNQQPIQPICPLHSACT